MIRAADYEAVYRAGDYPGLLPIGMRHWGCEAGMSLAAIHAEIARGCLALAHQRAPGEVARRPRPWDNKDTTQRCRGAALTAPGVDTEGVIFYVG